MRVIRRAVAVDPQTLSVNLHPVLARVYAARNVRCVSELDHSLQCLHPYADLSGIDAAVDLLEEALRAQERILVVADFDADGATSCAVAVRGLRLLGARDVGYLIPNRFEYGYGLTPEIVEVAAGRAPHLLITVDNGISSVEGAAAAARCGIKVLVTDHHLPRADGRLPHAEAIVNPNLPGDMFPSKSLAGVGVIFYVLAALRARLRERGWFARTRTPEPNLAQLLDLVALGTVADVVALDRNNRILVAQGLARIRQGRAQPGVKALLHVAGRDARRAVAADLAYAVAPRLNAAGRLTDMGLGVECLLADDGGAAMRMARKLDELNRERRVIEAKMQTEAMARVDTLSLHGTEGLPFGLCLFEESWHQGVIGIVASRVRERVHRPVIAFASQDGTELKGSARSVPGLHVRDVLDAVAARHPGLIRRFGGHAMAAGLTLARGDLEAFRAAFDAEVRRLLTADDLRGFVHSDGSLAPEHLTLGMAETLRAAGPWGQGFPEPVFDDEFEVVKARVVGDRHWKLRLGMPGRNAPVEAIAFNAVDDGPALGDVQRLHAAYRLDVNLFRGARSAQLVLEHIEAL